jgi:hypothetical protein
VKSRPLGRGVRRGFKELVEGKNVPVQPDEAFGGGVLLFFELVKDEVLEGFAEGRGGELAVADFLYALVNAFTSSVCRVSEP